MGGHGARAKPCRHDVSDAKVREAPLRTVAHCDESLPHQTPRRVVLGSAQLVRLFG